MRYICDTYCNTAFPRNAVFSLPFFRRRLMMNQYCGTGRIAGCQFSLHAMSDQFVNIVLSTLEEVDTSKVWMETDDISTCIRGKMVHVFDVVKAVCLHAAKTGKHVAM